jgi:hypothetical protein
LLYYHRLTLSIVGVFTFGGSWLLLRLNNWLIPLRMAAVEAVGLVWSQHNKSLEPWTVPVAKPQEVWLSYWQKWPIHCQLCPRMRRETNTEYW